MAKKSFGEKAKLGAVSGLDVLPLPPAKEPKKSYGTEDPGEVVSLGELLFALKLRGLVNVGCEMPKLKNEGSIELSDTIGPKESDWVCGGVEGEKLGELDESRDGPLGLCDTAGPNNSMLKSSSKLMPATEEDRGGAGCSISSMAAMMRDTRC